MRNRWYVNLCYLVLALLPMQIALAQGEGGGADYGPPGLGAEQENTATVPNELAKLGSHGIVGVKLSITLGGVTISEKTGMALVLSVSPLVIVTTQDILLDESQVPPQAEMRFSMQGYIKYVGEYGGSGGGMGPSGLSGMGMGMGMGSVIYRPVTEERILPAGGFGSGSSDWQLVKSESTRLLFGMAVNSKETPGTMTSAAFWQAAILAEKIGTEIDETWKTYQWLDGLNPSLHTGPASDTKTVSAVLSPKGTSTIICAQGRIYGREEILEQYLTAYKKRADSIDPFSGPGGGAIGGPGLGGLAPGTSPLQPANRAAGTQAEESIETDELRQRIVTAMLEFKSAITEGHREVARRKLEEILLAEFDARRSLKAQDIAALKNRVEALEQAERMLIEQRAVIIKQRLDSLLK